MRTILALLFVGPWLAVVLLIEGAVWSLWRALSYLSGCMIITIAWATNLDRPNEELMDSAEKLWRAINGKD